MSEEQDEAPVDLAAELASGLAQQEQATEPEAPAESSPSEASAGSSGEGTAPDASASPGEPTQTGSPSPSLFERIAQRGVDLRGKYRDEDQLVEAAANAFKLISRRDDDAQVGRALRESPEDIYRRLKAHFEPAHQAQPQSPQTAQPAERAKAWDAPPWKDEWLQQVVSDEEGAIKARPGAEPGVVENILRWQNWAAAKQRELLRDPKSALLPVIEEDVRRAAQEEAAKVWQAIQQRDQSAAVEREVQTRVDRDKAVLYQDGDPSKGPSEFGQVFGEFLRAEIDHMNSLGVQLPPSEVYDMAQTKAALHYMAGLRQQQQAPPPVQPAPTPQPPATPKAATAATRRPSVAAVQEDDEEWPEGRTLSDVLLEQLRKGQPLTTTGR